MDVKKGVVFVKWKCLRLQWAVILTKGSIKILFNQIVPQKILTTNTRTSFKKFAIEYKKSGEVSLVTCGFSGVNYRSAQRECEQFLDASGIAPLASLPDSPSLMKNMKKRRIDNEELMKLTNEEFSVF